MSLKIVSMMYEKENCHKSSQVASAAYLRTKPRRIDPIMQVIIFAPVLFIY